MKNKLAVFDIDGTIFRSSLVIELVNILVEKKIFPKAAEKEIEKDYVAWINRKGSYDVYIHRVVVVFEKYIKGVSQTVVRNITRELIGQQRYRTYIFTRNLIKELKEKNYFLFAISGSPDVLVEEFTKILGFDDFRGTDYEVVKGRYTGAQPIDTYLHKSEILKEFLKDHKQFYLKQTIGIGDSEGDIPFLKLVGKPIAFNPAIKLADYAQQKGWRIVVERKNVIYEIKKTRLLEIES